MKTEKKIGYLKFRNDYGQVLVAYTKEDNVHEYRFGFAFCSPDDFNLSRKVRTARGQAIALNRLKLCPEGILFEDFESESKDKDPEFVHLLLRAYVLGYLNHQHCGLTKKYRGKDPKERFTKWFIPFIDLEQDKNLEKRNEWEDYRDGY